MDWESFQNTIKLLLSRYYTDSTFEDDQLELMIEEKKIVFTRQEYQRVCLNLQKYSVSPTFLFNANQLEVFVDIVENNRFLNRFPTDGFEIKDLYISYRISDPSDELLLSFVSSLPKEDISEFRRSIPPRLIFRGVGQNETDEFSLFDLIRRITRVSNSLKIVSVEKTSFDDMKKYTNSFLFGISYNIGVVYKSVFDIDDLSYTREYISHRRNLRPNEIETPKLFYKEELIEQYSLALSSYDPFIQFIAYYHVMEHFFDEVYKGALISEVREIIQNPGFSTKKTKEINKIIDTVQNKTSITKGMFARTELEALELTIKAYVKLEQLFTGLSENYPSLINYYKSHEVSFSKGDNIDLSDYSNDKLAKKIAARIYKTRNSLVHSKSNTYVAKERGIFHPFSDDKELAKEIPLMKTIAESIIIRSAEEI